MTKNRSNFARRPGGSSVLQRKEGGTSTRLKKATVAGRSLLGDSEINDVTVIMSTNTRRFEKVVVTRDTPVVKREVSPVYPAKARMVTLLQLMRKRDEILDFSEVRTVRTDLAAFHEIDVYVTYAFWLNDGDLEVTTKLLELQTPEEYISPRVHPVQAERVG